MPPHKLCPYPVEVIHTVGEELFHRSVSATPKLLTNDAGVLLDQITERGYMLPSGVVFRMQVGLSDTVARWVTSYVIYKQHVSIPYRTRLERSMSGFAHLGLVLDTSITDREGVEPALWEHYRWLLGYKPALYIETTWRLLYLIHKENL